MQLFLILVMGVFCTSLSFADDLLGLPPLHIPANNSQTEDKIELGRILFNDIRLSADNSISCASCHHADKAFTDGLTVPKGINNQTGTRNAPTVINAAFYNTLFLDGRAKSLEDQALGPFVNSVEHGLKDYTKIINVVRSDTHYLQMFKQAFNLSADKISIEHISKAIASFERTLIAGNSPFDQYYFGRDHTKMSDSAARGLRLFRRKGNCANCHEISWDSALFMDNRFYNIGVGFNRIKSKVNAIKSALANGKKVDQLGLTTLQNSELGRFNVTHDIRDMGKFKTPTLRNISLTAPYMHDGSMKTLEEVVEYYDKGGDPNRFIDAAIFPLHFSKHEKADLVEFLKALTSPQLLAK
ncbi:MAG: cytochrome-c peroxidase [Methylococcaceae bacterium]|nr:cytochrome-c peroxidase [Methylococcaceae bacterium]